MSEVPLTFDRKWIRWLGAASGVLVLLCLLPRFHGMGIYDDAYMFARYADNFIAEGIMAWNPGGEAVYGATSLLYVVFLIPFRLLFPENIPLSLSLASMFFGFLSLYLLFKMVKKPGGALIQTRYLVLWLSLAISFSGLAVHFMSGMETTFVMAWSVLYLVILLDFEKRPKRRNVLWAGFLGGLAFWVRPDMMVFALGIPGWMWLWASSQEIRRGALKIGLMSFFLLILSVVLNWWAFGSPLPASFFAKTSGIYGDAFREAYRLVPWYELARFVLKHWLPLGLIVMATFFAWKNRKASPPKSMEVALLLCSLIFTGFYLFFVLQIMGYGQRFYYPLLPFLLLMALRGLNYFPQEKMRELLARQRKGFAILLSLILLGYFGRYIQEGFFKERAGAFGSFNLSETYQQRVSDYWVALEGFSSLPDDFTIATTEVGMPAAMNPKKAIIDLAGLNEPDLFRQPLPMEFVLKKYRPDLIYLPHEHYDGLLREFSRSATFAEEWLVFEKEPLNAWMGIAIQRDSPYFNKMLRIITPHVKN